MSATPIKQSLFVLSHGTQEEGGSAIDAGYDLDALKRYAEELHAETVREYAEFRAADERDGQPDLDIWNIHDALVWKHTDPKALKAREIGIPRADRHVESWYADCGNHNYYSIRRFEALSPIEYQGAALRAKYGLDLDSPASIVAAINTFTGEDHRRAHNFGHIVLGDMNLDRQSIGYCLACYHRGEHMTHRDRPGAEQVDEDCYVFLTLLAQASDDVLEQAQSLYWGDE